MRALAQFKQSRFVTCVAVSIKSQLAVILRIHLSLRNPNRGAPIITPTKKIVAVALFIHFLLHTRSHCDDKMEHNESAHKSLAATVFSCPQVIII